MELEERAPEFTQVPRDVTLTTGDNHVIAAEITGVPKPNIYVTDKDGNVVGEGEIEEVDRETVRFTLDLPDVQVCVRWSKNTHHIFFSYFHLLLLTVYHLIPPLLFSSPQT